MLNIHRWRIPKIFAMKKFFSLSFNVLYYTDFSADVYGLPDMTDEYSCI